MVTDRQPMFGELLRRYRLAAGLTQEELAERAHISRRAVSDLERGARRKPWRDTVTLLADALGLADDERQALERAVARARRPVLVPFVGETAQDRVTAGEWERAPVLHLVRNGEQSESAALRQALPVGCFLGALPSGPLVGREAELESALRLIEEDRGERGHLLLLAGEAGVGKTRLAQEISLQLRDRGFLICAGSCYESRQTSAFIPFQEAFTVLYALAPPSLQSEVPTRWPYLAALLPAESLPVPPTGAGESDRLLWSASSFLQVMAEHAPVALLIDDLHWADRSSLELLQHIARQTRSDRVVIVGTYRDVDLGRHHALGRTLHELERGGLAEKITLKRLSREATAALVAAHLGEDQIREKFAELLYERTEGNPFFLRQVLRDLIEKGDLYQAGERWGRKDNVQIVVPESIRSVVVQRVAKLSADTQEILHEASTLGQRFWFDDLVAMTERDERALEAALEEAMRAAVLQELDGERCAFDHALTQQALYGELTARRKQRLHLAAGEALERLPERKRKNRVAELAWHFLQGHHREKALIYSLRAGDAAEAIYAHAEAEMHYRATVDLARELEDEAHEAEALERLAELFFRIFRFAKQLEVADAAAELYRRLGDLEGEGRVVGLTGAAYTLLGRKAMGIQRLEPLRQRFEGRPASPAHVAVYEGLVTLYWQSGRFPEAEEVSERLLEMARSLGDDGVLARAQGRRGVVLSFLTGREAEGEEAILESIRLAERVGDLHTLLVGVDNMSSVYESRGDWERARQYSERHLDVARRMGSPVRTVSALMEIGTLNLWQGGIAAARDSLQEALAGSAGGRNTVLRLGAGHSRTASHDGRRGRASQDLSGVVHRPRGGKLRPGRPRGSQGIAGKAPRA